MNPRCLASIILSAVSSTAVADWRYVESEDAMTGKQEIIAKLDSVGAKNLPFPLGGASQSQIGVRQHPRYGLDVLLTINSGQILCNSDCQVTVRFDEDQPIKFIGMKPSDQGSRLIFLRNAKRFVDLARKAKRVRIQMPIYDAGERILDFWASNYLLWPVRFGKYGKPEIPRLTLAEQKTLRSTVERKGFKFVDRLEHDAKTAQLIGSWFMDLHQGPIERRKSIQVLWVNDRAGDDGNQFKLSLHEVKCDSEITSREAWFERYDAHWGLMGKRENALQGWSITKSGTSFANLIFSVCK